MTICRLQIEEDMGKFYLKRTLRNIAVMVISILLFAFITVPLSIVIGEKYSTDSPEQAIYFYAIFALLIILIICYVIWLRTTGREELCLQYIFAITSSTDIRVINCCDPLTQSLIKKSPSSVMDNFGFYGLIFSLNMQTRYMLDYAWKLSYASKFDIVGFLKDSFDKGAHYLVPGRSINKVSNLKVHKNYITFKTVETCDDSKQKKHRYRISRKFTNSDELIAVLENLQR